MRDAGVRAFVPGHVTGFFSPRYHEDPARTGSRGAGLTLSDGVTVRVAPADTSSVIVNGEAAPFEPAERVLEALGVDARVVAETVLPLGAGFGVSGAVALGTALAANHAFGCARSENALVGTAHRAEVEAGTGLGDVVAQARGGVPIRLAPGGPGHGSLDGVPASTPVEYLSFGPVSTPDVLAGDTGRIERAGDRALDRLVGEPTLPTFMAAARTFADEADLIVPRVREVIESVEAAGGSAAMAMLGETVFALGSALTDAGYEAAACETHPPGATIEEVG